MNQPELMVMVGQMTPYVNTLVNLALPMVYLDLMWEEFNRPFVRDDIQVIPWQGCHRVVMWLYSVLN